MILFRQSTKKIYNIFGNLIFGNLILSMMRFKDQYIFKRRWLFLLGMIHVRRPWKLSHFQDPQPPLSIYVQNFPPRVLERPISNKPSSGNDNQSIKIIQGWLLFIIRPFLQVCFRFQYQLIYLVWLSLDFFSFSWNLTICFFMALYYCVQLSKNIRKYLLFIIIHIFSTYFPTNLFYMHNLKT